MPTVSPHVARVAAGLAALALAALSLVWWRGRESARPSSAAQDAVVAELRLFQVQEGYVVEFFIEDEQG
jgi:hypothetical protein